MSERTQPKVPADATQPDGTGPAAGAGCILIVEDERHTRLALQRFLAREGFTSIGFGTAGDAVAWLTADPPGNGSAGAAPSLAGAVVDVHLPDGDGLELTSALRRHVGHDVPIVIVSGDTSMQTLGRLREAGADRFVGKPLSLTALREALAGSVSPARAAPVDGLNDALS